ncbi:MAG TPA: hypothetical protein VJ692_08580 [Nitrospiraceae bacterium]|nr:hypothetical protein [Nitrospiraceae bacterium]
MASLLTQEQIESAIAAMPPQGRIMLRLLLLRYLDLTPEDIEYMALDRPDPRRQTGMKGATLITRETLDGISDRATQYRTIIRQQRERQWLQIECLRRQIAMSEAICSLAERLLRDRFAMDMSGVQDIKTQARSAVTKPMVRQLDASWERDEITEEDYQRRRLVIEYQMQLRRLDRERKRLESVRQAYLIANGQSLQDHEIAHIWGIPAGSLAARKAKYLQHYLQALQGSIAKAASSGQQETTHPIDLWKETFAVLSGRSVERSVSIYDGLEGTEAALIDTLTAFAQGTLPEEVENRLWLLLVQESSHQAEYGTKLKSLFGLQRFAAILADLDTSPDALEHDLLARISPAAKEAAAELEGAQAQEGQLSEMGEHVLRSFLGEERKL